MQLVNYTVGMTQQLSGGARFDGSLPSLKWLPEALALVEGSSSRIQLHANEFFKLTLPAQGQHARRIHVWPESSPHDGHGNIHGHCWPFTSLVLTGTLIEELFTVHTGADYHEYEFYSDDTPMKYLGHASLRRESVHPYSQGDLYRRGGSQLHTAHAFAETTVTAVAHTLSRSQSARVYVPTARGERTERSRSATPIEVSWIREQLIRVLTESSIERKKP